MSVEPISPRRGSGSWTGSTPVRNTAGPSRGRSGTCTSRRASSTPTPVPSCATSTPRASPTRASRWSWTLPTAAPGLSCPACSDVSVWTRSPSTPDSTSPGRPSRPRLGEIVSSARAAFGVRFDPVGERLSLVDERGHIIEDDRALLVLLDLVAAERRSGRVALPVTTTRVAEQVAASHGTQVEWTTTSPDDLTRVGREDSTIFGGDGRGGFIVPEFSSVFDGAAAFVRLIGLVARTQL